MLNDMRTRVIILAAGRGTRMNPVRSQTPSASAALPVAGRTSNGVNNTALPKVLTPFEGKPIITHLLDAVRESGVDERPVIVIGHEAEKIKAVLGDGYDYILQAKQLGTGHAVQCAEQLLVGKTDQVIVLYGDHPFVKASTITNLRAFHEQEHCPLSMMTVRVEDFDDWRLTFADFGRVARDASGKIAAIVEAKDATPAQKEIREVSPAFFCFDGAWLWPHLKKIGNNNAKREYYLTDLVGMAIREGACVASLQIDPRESIGVNTPAHLELVKLFSE